MKRGGFIEPPCRYADPGNGAASRRNGAANVDDTSPDDDGPGLHPGTGRDGGEPDRDPDLDRADHAGDNPAANDTADERERALSERPAAKSKRDKLRPAGAGGT